MKNIEKYAERVAEWIGSTDSIVIHSIMFIVIFGSAVFGISFTTILLALTTVVSLEAIYLSIFIQMSVNKTKKHLNDHIRKTTKKKKNGK